MTLTEALAALQAAGKIKSARLPGMCLRDRRPAPDGASTRVTIRRAFLALDELEFPIENIWDIWGATDPPTVEGEPDLDDPATVGCLTALAEEAFGHDVEVFKASDGETDFAQWIAWRPDGAATVMPHVWEIGGGATRGEALADALIALATEATP